MEVGQAIQMDTSSDQKGFENTLGWRKCQGVTVFRSLAVWYRVWLPAAVGVELAHSVTCDRLAVMACPMTGTAVRTFLVTAES
jgi:hypothetical protein